MPIFRSGLTQFQGFAACVRLPARARTRRGRIPRRRLLCFLLSRWIPDGGMNAMQTLHLKKIGSVPDAPLETDLRAHLGWIVGNKGGGMSAQAHLEKSRTKPPPSMTLPDSTSPPTHSRRNLRA